MVRLTSFLLWAFVFLSLSCSYEFFPHSMRSLFVFSMILISTVAHYGCVESNTLFHRLFFPKSADNISGEVARLTVNGIASIKFSWINPANEDFKETTLSWTRSNDGPGSESVRPGAPGSSDEITLELEPDEYTFTLVTVDTQGDASKPWSRVIHVGPSCHPNNSALSSLRDTNFSSGFNLDNFNTAAATDGFRSLGAAGGGLAGSSISSGDINGDGIDDVLIGAPNVNTNRGAVYVIFGKENGLVNMTLPPSSADGFSITGTAPGRVGSSISLGDINGDGIDDVLIGASAGTRGNGYVIFSKRSGLTNMTLPPSSADGFTITGAPAGNFLGVSISSGDINGDGIDDVLIGDSGVSSNKGAGYVIFGREAAAFNDIMLADAPDFGLGGAPDTGFRILGADGGDRAGTSISSGDINGDGIGDALIGATFGGDTTINEGAGYVIFGKESGLTDISLNSLPPDDGFTITGVNPDDRTGFSISSDDINGDGIDDVLLGAFKVNSYTGAGYVIFGKESGLTNISLSSLPVGDGFTITGAAANDQAGRSISSGDINGDGIGDVLIGARNGGTSNNEGAGYVIFGKESGLTNISLGSLPVDDGFTITGAAANDQAGHSISSGDINGDGIGDALIGASQVDSGFTNVGAGYTVLGACQPSSP